MNSISCHSKFHYAVFTTNTVVLIVQLSVFVFGIWAARVGGKTFTEFCKTVGCMPSLQAWSSPSDPYRTIKEINYGE